MRKITNNKIIKNCKGQALVEMALVLPIFLMLIMGMIEFGRIFNAYLIVTNASREGARIAVVGGTDTDVDNSITNTTNTLRQEALTINVTPTQSSRNRGAQVTVTVHYNLEMICPIISSIIPNPFPINSITVMRME
ncbi:MAG: TadE family protein [Deltaproteobacteria bacterium]